MVKIINDLMYDTDDSELIYEDRFNKRLYYRTFKGNFFVVYNNGELLPTSEDTIKKILGQNDVEKYIELFGEPQEA